MADHCEADPCTADAIDRASAWQPVETAPHDCQILLYSRDDMYVGVWCKTLKPETRPSPLRNLVIMAERACIPPTGDKLTAR